MSEQVEFNAPVPDRVQIIEHLKQRKKLLLNSESINSIHNIISDDTFAATTAQAISLKAERIHQQDLLKLQHEPGRKVILPTSRALFDRVTTLAMANILDSSPHHTDRIITETLRMAELDDWNDPHFLCTAEMTAGVSLVLNWYYDDMPPVQREKIMTAIVNFALIPGLKQIDSDTFWANSQNNWNSVCTCGLVLGAIATAPLVPEISAQVIENCLYQIKYGNQAFGSAGDHNEGPTYWALALNYTVYRDQALADIGLSQPPIPGFSDCWQYARDMVGPSGLCYNHGDTTLDFERPKVIGWIANTFNSAETANWQRSCSDSTNPFDLIWLSKTSDNLPITSKKAELAIYQNAGTAVIHHHLGPQKSYTAISCGTNNRDHAHLDLMSFVLEKGNTRFICDLGRGNYALPGYFDPLVRYQYLRAGTSGHGTLVCRGQNQSADSYCDLVSSHTTSEGVCLKFEIIDPINQFRQFRSFDFRKSELIITDELNNSSKPIEKTDLTWQLFTSQQIQTDENQAVISAGESKLKCEIISPTQTDWHYEQVITDEADISTDGYSRLFFHGTHESETMIQVRIT